MDDHVALRRQLFGVDIDVELHLVRAHSLCELIDQLHTHAALEDASMYPWAQVHLLLRSAMRRLFIRIGHSMRALGRRVEAHPTANLHRTTSCPQSLRLARASIERSPSSVAGPAVLWHCAATREADRGGARSRGSSYISHTGTDYDHSKENARVLLEALRAKDSSLPVLLLTEFAGLEPERPLRSRLLFGSLTLDSLESSIESMLRDVPAEN